MINIGHKIKFTKGEDASEMMVFKLVSNFIRTGKMEVTVKRAKVIKAKVDRLVGQAKENKKNVLIKRLRDMQLVNKLTDVIVPALKDHKYGYVKIAKLGSRIGDGAELARIEWVTPIVVAPSVEKPAEAVVNKEEKPKVAVKAKAKTTK